MSNIGPSRFVRDMDEKCGVPMCIYWGAEQMAEWICEIGYPQYRECIETNYITGRHLICLDASALNRTGITDFEHIKDIAAKIRELLGINNITTNTRHSTSDPMIAYMEMKQRTGEAAQHVPYKAFLHKNRKWFE